MSLPRFNIYSPCVKCGETREPLVEYCHGDIHVNADSTVAYSSGDYLVRTCCRCSYIWQEACLDADVRRALTGGDQ